LYLGPKPAAFPWSKRGVTSIMQNLRRGRCQCTHILAAGRAEDVLQRQNPQISEISALTTPSERLNEGRW